VRETTETDWPHRVEGERERARTRAVGGRARVAWLSWTGLNGPNFVFLFLPNFKRLFYIFSMDFKSYSNQIQIQTISNLCIKQKNNLGSA
jgi:hypothetical protein